MRFMNNTFANYEARYRKSLFNRVVKMNALRLSIHNLFTNVALIFCITMTLLICNLDIDNYLLCFGGGLIGALGIIVFKQYKMEKLK